LELLYLTAVTDFKRTYFGTALGHLWSIARPLMLFGVLLAVFTHLFRFASVVPHYPVFLLLNIVLFGFFQEATSLAVPSLVGQEAVIRKTQFPRLVVPLSVVLVCLFNLGPNLVVTLVFVLAFGVTPLWTWLLLPLAVLALFVFTTAVAMITSALFPRYRDVGIIWTVVSTALFYATPVLYPLYVLSSSTLRNLIALNPLTPIFDLVHKWVTDPHAPGPAAASMGGPVRLLVAIGLYVAVCVLAAWLFEREAPRIAEDL
jgi:ABC-2 type transport system permease protein